MEVQVDSFHQPFLIKTEEYENLIAAPNSSSCETWATFLAYEDPCLKGYFETRARYVSDSLKGALFNSIGEARASVVVSGQVVGVWQWNRTMSSLTVELFRKLTKSERQKYEEALADLSLFVSATDTVVQASEAN